jgi:hypothetical protein
MADLGHDYLHVTVRCFFDNTGVEIMNGFIEQLKRLFGLNWKKLFRRLIRRCLLRRGVDVEIGGDDPARSTTRIVPVKLNPHGFGDTYDRHAPGVPAMERAAAGNIFRHFELDWIPPEYFQVLERDDSRNPVDAFQRFCDWIGVRYINLTDNYRRAETRDRLEQAVGILLELGQIPGLSQANRDCIVAEMQAMRHDRAEGLLETARIVLGLMAEMEELEAEIRFPYFQDLWLPFVKDLAENVLGINAGATDHIRTELQKFKELEEAARQLEAELDGAIGWMESNWPTGTEWGDEEENLQTRLGLIIVSESLRLVMAGKTLEASHQQALEVYLNGENHELLASIANREVDDDRLEEAVVLLNDVLEQLMAFVVIIQEQFEGAAGSFGVDPEAEKEAKWNAAMAALELDFQYGEASASDLWTVIKGKYRRLASKYHPDKNPGDPVAEEKMSRVNDAYAYLEAIK